MSRVRQLASAALLVGGLAAPATALALASSGPGSGPGGGATECTATSVAHGGPGAECPSGGEPPAGEPPDGGPPASEPPGGAASGGEGPGGEPLAGEPPGGAASGGEQPQPQTGQEPPPVAGVAPAESSAEGASPPAYSPADAPGSGGTAAPSDAAPSAGIGPTGTGHSGGSSRAEHRQRSSGHARRHRPIGARHAAKPVELTPSAARKAGGTLAPQPLAKPSATRLDAPFGAGAAGTLTAGALEPAPTTTVPVGLLGADSAPAAFLVPIYKHAARRYEVPWRVLAAINSIETDYGRDLSVSSAGAEGWMQFMPSTWATYGDGGNPYDPHDAIFAAARLLRAAGARHDLPGAIFAYDHADWYVAAVLWRASTIDVRAHGGRRRGDRYALPLAKRYMNELGRTDDGVDIETAPNGAAVYSIAAGIVVDVASDPGGFGPDYPVVLTTSGPLAGRYIYYGHVAASLVRVGQPVLAGEPIAVVGHTGDAASLGHGHIEIGFCDSSGDPLSHHGAAEAWTPSGQVMRSVLVSLSAKPGTNSR